jgi:hypothetical protein
MILLGINEKGKPYKKRKPHKRGILIKSKDIVIVVWKLMTDFHFKTKKEI